MAQKAISRAPRIQPRRRTLPPRERVAPRSAPARPRPAEPELRSQRHLLTEAVGSVGEELRHLRAVEEKGDSPMTAVLVLVQMVLALALIVAIEVAIAFVFYFGWL
jgi:hypothetical protein